MDKRYSRHGLQTDAVHPHGFGSAIAFERWLASVPLAIFVYLGTFVTSVARGESFSVSWSWVPSLDVRFSLYLDGLSLLFGLLISGMGIVVFAYSPGYFGNQAHRTQT